LNAILRKDQGGVEINVTIVSNCLSDSDDIASIALEYNCRVVQNSENVGYGAACNIGARDLSGDLILFLNPDVYISTGSIKALIKAASTREDGVAFGPTVYDSGRRRKHKRVSIADPSGISRSFLDHKLALLPTAYLSGCALMVRRKVFEAVNGFDPAIFLYYEDDDLCIRLREHGQLYIVGTAAALHSHGRSVEESPRWRELRAKSLGYSMMYVMRKHRGLSGVVAALFRVIFRMLSPLNALSSRYRNKTINMTVGLIDALKRKERVRLGYSTEAL
jgi:GT2 family glycosyltransferase